MLLCLTRSFSGFESKWSNSVTVKRQTQARFRLPMKEKTPFLLMYIVMINFYEGISPILGNETEHDPNGIVFLVNGC